MLLAAGKGERMRPLTLKTPKPLLTARGKPLIAHHLEALASAGIQEVVINVSWLGEQIEAYCEDGRRWGLSIAYSREPEPLETAGGIIQALPQLGASPFVLVNADIYTDVDFESLARRADALAEAHGHLVLVDNPAHNLSGDFTLRDGQVWPKENHSLTYAGVALYHPAFFAGCAPGKRPLLPLLQKAIAEGRLHGEHHRGLWTDVGTPERLAALDELN